MTVTQARTGAPAQARETARGTLDLAVQHLLGLQHEQGWWQGELETNVTMDAEDLLLREFLGVRTPEQTAAAARWIRSCQRADGTWANFRGGEANLSTTVEAYVALRLAGDAPDAAHMLIAADWIRAQGGIPATRVFTRIWLALFGAWSWDDLPVMPPEMIYLPAWFPLNVYDWGCWARQTIVPLTIVGSLRPVRPLPFGLNELSGLASTAASAGAAARDPWGVVFNGLDRALHAYERRGAGAAPARAIRRAAMRRCAEWIIARQEKDGCWGGIQPPWVYSLMALHLLGYGLDHPVIKRGLDGLDRFTIWEDSPEGPVRRLEACQSPVWDTVLALVGLGDAGVAPEHPQLQSAARWILDEEILGPGDWQVKRPDLAPGGWAFEFDNDGYPDVDDTAEVVLALRRFTGGADNSKGQPATGGADNSKGQPATGGADNSKGQRAAEASRTASLNPVGGDSQGSRDGRPEAGPSGCPAGGSGGVVPPRQAQQATDRAVRWLTGMQSRDGGWGAFDADNTAKLVTKLPFCDFGEVVDPPSADVTAHTVEALAALGLGASKEARRGVTWLVRAQESDGSWFGRWGANYIYGTGAVVPALIAAGVRPGKPVIRRAMDWLVSRQNPDGGWGEDLRSYDDPVGWSGRGESTASQTAWALLALLAGGGPQEQDAVERGVRWLAQTQRPDGTWDEPQFTGTGFPGDFYINYHLYRLVFPVSALGRYLSGSADETGVAS
jgi:squalene-hopene/tetraprenyl-beta-curcumene cyclase